VALEKTDKNENDYYYLVMHDSIEREGEIICFSDICDEYKIGIIKE
jgi:hypothetical protein